MPNMDTLRKRKSNRYGYGNRTGHEKPGQRGGAAGFRTASMGSGALAFGGRFGAIFPQTLGHAFYRSGDHVAFAHRV